MGEMGSSQTEDEFRSDCPSLLIIRQEMNFEAPQKDDENLELLGHELRILNVYWNKIIERESEIFYI